MSNDSPRRCHIYEFVPAEKAIWDAVQEVEKMPADVRLTNAVLKLQEAREWVADFVDDVKEADHYPRPIKEPNAKETVIEFQKWTDLNGWFWYQNPARWLNYHNGHSDSPKSTAELYDLFLQSSSSSTTS